MLIYNIKRRFLLSKRDKTAMFKVKSFIYSYVFCSVQSMMFLIGFYESGFMKDLTDRIQRKEIRK